MVPRTLLAATVGALLLGLAFPTLGASNGVRASWPVGTENETALSIVGTGELTPTKSETHKVPIDVSAHAVFLLISSPGDLELSLTSPSGRKFSSHHSEGRDEGMHVDSILGIAPGGMAIVNVESPETGEWTARVIAHSMPDTVHSIVYMLKLIQNTGEQGPTLHSLIPDRPYHRGEPVLVRASLLEDGRPVRGADVEAGAGYEFEFEAPTTLRLHDDGVAPDSVAGDGIWSGALPAIPRGGLYEIDIEANRKATPGLHAFHRTISQTLRVTRTVAYLTHQNSDFVRDSDGDGMPDEFVVRLGVHTDQADSLGIFGYLSGPKGPPQRGDARTHLVPAGDHAIDLVFPLKALADQCGPGAYTLDSLVFFEQNDPYGTLYVFDEPKNVHRTRTYTEDELEYEPIHATGEATVEGIDADHDGKYEFLAIDVDLVLQVGGTYAWSAVLGPSSAMMPPQGSGLMPLPQGHTKMRLLFPGACLAAMPRGARITIDNLTMNYVPRPPVPRNAPHQRCEVHGVALRGVPPPERFDSSDVGGVRSRQFVSANHNALYSCP